MLEPAVVKPSGDLDIASVDEFRKELDDATLESEETLIVDLSDVGFMDSSGLRVILETNERLRREHRSVAVVAPRGTAAAVLLTLAGLRRTLTVVESRRAALRQRAS